MIQPSRRPVRFAMGLAFLLGALSACSGTPTEEESDGSLQGKLVSIHMRFDDGRSETSYLLRLANGEEIDLQFSTPPDLFPGTRIKVWGDDRAGTLIVDRFEVVPRALLSKDGQLGQALIDAEPIPATNMVMALVDVGGGVGNVQPAEFEDALFGDQAESLKNYYLENSYGMHELTGMVMPDVYSYPMSDCNTQDLTRGLTGALRDQIHQDAGVPDFDLYLWYFEGNCSWSGMSSGQDTYYDGSSGCVVLAQEPGHSFGLAHSSSLECQEGGQVVSFLDDPNECTHNEYGNRYDTMGGGCNHFSAYHKVYRTYLQGCNGVKVRSSNTFTLHAIENPCNGVQVLQVPMAKVRPFASSGGGGGDEETELAYYLVELRAPIGFDSRLQPSVLINAAPEFRFFQESRGWQNRGEHIWLLDMAPEVTSGGGRGFGGGDGSAHALAVGQTFTDPAGGVSITTEAVSDATATIRVDIATASGEETTCLDDAPFTAPGMATCTGDDGGGATGGAAGAAGAAGSAGAAGAAGGGAAGAGGLDAGGGGSGGADASSGAGGGTDIAGAPATGGESSAGAGGTAGSADAAAGSGGTPVTATGGAPIASAGAPGAGQSGAPPVAPTAAHQEIQGSCAIRTAPASSGSSNRASLLALALAGLLVRRRARAKDRA